MLLEARIAQPTTEAEAVRLARELYGLAVAAKSLPGEYDDNFHLTVLHNVVGAQPEMAVPRSNSFETTNESAICNAGRCSTWRSARRSSRCHAFA